MAWMQTCPSLDDCKRKSGNLNRKISSGAAFILVTLVLLASGAIESSVLSAREQAENPPRIIDRAYCTKCHSDAGMLRKMQAKEGSGHFIFHQEGKATPPVAYQRNQAPLPARTW